MATHPSILAWRIPMTQSNTQQLMLLWIKSPFLNRHTKGKVYLNIALWNNPNLTKKETLNRGKYLACSISYSMIYLIHKQPNKTEHNSVGELRNMILERRHPVHSLYSFPFLGPCWEYSTSKRNEVYFADWRTTWNHLISLVLTCKYSSSLTLSGQESESIASSILPSPLKLIMKVTNPWITLS